MIELLKRNSRLVAIIAVVIILLAVDIVFLMQWQELTEEKESLETQKNSAEVQLGLVRAQYDLDTLRAEEAELSRSPEFPSAFPVVDLSLYFAEGAYLTHITLNVIEPPVKVGTETINGKNYPAYETKVSVTGSLSQVISFLQYLEGGAFTSLKIRDLLCTSTGAVWDADFTVVVISQH